jgi:hypothetical protein
MRKLKCGNKSLHESSLGFDGKSRVRASIVVRDFIFRYISPHLASTRRICHAGPVDESRKRMLLIAASILAVRKLANWDERLFPALESAIADAVR